MKSRLAAIVSLLAVLAIILAGPAAGKSPVFAQSLPPANDNFADATSIFGLPFTNTTDNSAGSLEAGEPAPGCAYYLFDYSVWYAYTPQVSGLVSAHAYSEWNLGLTVYTGTSLGDLVEQGSLCSFWGDTGLLTFSAQAGVTYYIQVGTWDGWTGSVDFFLDVPPPPVASFWTNPGDPSVLDVVAFVDNSYDPAGVGLQSAHWSFGDGASSNDLYPTHQYAADGDYTVQETVTTTDGRSATASLIVPVRTHDVAITKFSTPTSASAGQTRSLVVGVNSKRQAETVEVVLYKSIVGGYEQVGSLTQVVPVRPANRTTDFKFTYTFTADDARLGKVAFRAVAVFPSGRDSLPADNEITAPPTKVSK